MQKTKCEKSSCIFHEVRYLTINDWIAALSPAWRVTAVWGHTNLLKYFGILSIFPALKMAKRA
ncbi:hypothetical protein [Methanosarcina sp. UBA289]|uniref:hypothetical protein n=1 Tax=Methanosarcina sp. UBA289 TaxID=1915574 RepID=UPI0025CE46D9|nr:hypothetical protein [Methanosarcina sp. UBA289]